MTILVYGAGAVGSLFGARFSAAGLPVLLIGRPGHVAEIREHGLRVEGTDPGTFRVEAATEVPPGVAADLGLLTVKTFDLRPAAAALARAIPPVPVLLPQNGLGFEAEVAATFVAGGWPEAAALLVRAVHAVPATWVGPGVVRAAGSGEIVLPDPQRSGAGSAAIARFLALFRSAGFAVRTVPSIEREVWRKALVNAAVNPVTALHRVPNGRLAEEPWRGEARELLREARDVGASLGFDLPLAEAEADLDRVVRATAANRSSMLQDLDRGRPTEIEAISGEILRLGTAHGLDLPATRRAVARVRAEAARGARAAQPS